jgi:uncharacterized protein YjbI with pentapeptide repeats
MIAAAHHGVVMRVHWVRVLVILQFCIFEQVAAPAADFSGANLRGAHLMNADLSGSNLAGADLTDANLSGANLTNTNITQLQLDGACGSGTKLPVGLRIQPCPSRADADGNDRRTNVDQAPPEVRMQTQDSEQRPDREEVSSNR